jgi:hypothetical protein
LWARAAYVTGTGAVLGTAIPESEIGSLFLFPPHICNQIPDVLYSQLFKESASYDRISATPHCLFQSLALRADRFRTDDCAGSYRPERVAADRSQSRAGAGPGFD